MCGGTYEVIQKADRRIKKAVYSDILPYQLFDFWRITFNMFADYLWYIANSHKSGIVIISDSF